MQHIITLAQYREAKTILATTGLRPSLYRLAAHVVDPAANPNPYGRRVSQ